MLQTRATSGRVCHHLVSQHPTIILGSLETLDTPSSQRISSSPPRPAFCPCKHRSCDSLIPVYTAAVRTRRRRPKAYHGGFSLGFNCAEAVNFACADWLPWGQDAISKYRSFKHLAAFSLQKLLCNIAETPPERLVEDGERSLRHVAQALQAEVKEEAELRDSVFSCGA